MVMAFFVVMASVTLPALAHCGDRNVTQCPEMSSCVWNETEGNCESQSQRCFKMEEQACTESPACQWKHNKCFRAVPTLASCESDSETDNIRKARFCCRRFQLRCDSTKEICESDSDQDNIRKARFCCHKFQLRCDSIKEICESDSDQDNIRKAGFCCHRFQLRCDSIKESCESDSETDNMEKAGFCCHRFQLRCDSIKASCESDSERDNMEKAAFCCRRFDLRCDSIKEICESDADNFHMRRLCCKKFQLRCRQRGGRKHGRKNRGAFTTDFCESDQQTNKFRVNKVCCRVLSRATTSTTFTTTITIRRCELMEEAIETCAEYETQETCAATSECSWRRDTCKPSMRRNRADAENERDYARVSEQGREDNVSMVLLVALCVVAFAVVCASVWYVMRSTDGRRTSYVPEMPRRIERSSSKRSYE